MKIRRVVTGHSKDGKAQFVSDEYVEGTTAVLAPGSEMHRLWGTDETPIFPDDGSKPEGLQYFPSVGGVRFGLFIVPALSEVDLTGVDLEAGQAQMESVWPGLAAHMEPENPGMHTTDTIDFEYVVSGEVWLELDDGVEVCLKAGDTVVQNGTRHAWRNKTTEPCQMVVFLAGAKRSGA
jgi:mannose-6-phosphate isomerase-like protein (cupin superfamily)